MTQRVGPAGRWFSHLLMYFATVDIIVKAWQRGPFDNAEVKELLADAKMVGMLANFRNDLMHGGPLLDQQVGLFFDHMTEVNPWAVRLRQACERHVVTSFATPRSAPRKPMPTETEELSPEPRTNLAFAGMPSDAERFRFIAKFRLHVAFHDDHVTLMWQEKVHPARSA